MKPTNEELGKLKAPEIVLLNAYEANKCSYGATASALDLPLGTVKSRLHRARAKIARMRGQCLRHGQIVPNEPQH